MIRIQMILGVLALLALIGVPPAAAQSSTGCDDQLTAAEAQYRNGAFEQAIGSVTECLNQPTTAPAEAVRAYRMLALAHIRQNELVEARRAIINLLSVSPSYEADRVNDPPIFVSTVSLVKRELNLGPAAVPTQPAQPLLPRSTAANEARRFSPTSASPSSPQDDGPSFFQRSNTWLTIGGVMVGSGAMSGNNTIGLGVGAIGVGAGGEFTGIGVGGLAVSGGEALEGLMIGGLGILSGDRVDGIAIGGGGIGTGGRLRGLAIGGLGIGSGEAIRGIALGGLGVGTGGDLSGVALALLGVGGGGNVSGFTAGGIGVGAGRHMRGLHVGGVGITASQFSGVAVGSIVSSRRAAGWVIAPLYSRSKERFAGVSASLFNHVQGEQRGVTIGLLNIARTLHGVQFGALNYAGNNPLLLRVLPLINLNL
jgi:hypothetical protein